MGHVIPPGVTYVLYHTNYSSIVIENVSGYFPDSKGFLIRSVPSGKHILHGARIMLTSLMFYLSDINMGLKEIK